MQVVERVLGGRVVTVVVLGHHEDEGVARGDDLAPAFRVLAGVPAAARVLRLVEQRQADVREVDELSVEAPVPRR